MNNDSSLKNNKRKFVAFEKYGTMKEPRTVKKTRKLCKKNK